MGKVIRFKEKPENPPENLITSKPWEFRWSDWGSKHFIQVSRSQSAKLENLRKETYRKGDKGIPQLPPHSALRDGMACTVRALFTYRYNEEKMREVYYLAGLQGIPEALYEAAKIDGASGWQLLRRITLPLMTPTAFFALIISSIGAFQIFDNAYVLTHGGPGDASRTISMYIYEVGFKKFEMGYAATVSLSLLVILVTLTLIQNWLSEKWVHYD